MSEFTKFEEEHIVLLALESPDFFYRVASFMKPEYFERPEAEFIMALYREHFEKYEEVPNRDVMENIIHRELTVDDDVTKPVLELLNSNLDPRSVPYTKDLVVEWARKKQLGLLYDPETIAKAKEGDFAYVQQIVDDAAKISDVIIKPFRFFEDVDMLFEVVDRDYFTCGFSRLDKEFHDKGPARREVFTWVAPTGVGKSICLVNTSVANYMQGKNVLHVSLENDERVTGNRYLGCFTELPIVGRVDNKEAMKKKLTKIRGSSESELFVIYFPTDTVNVDAVEIAVKDLDRQYGFKPDVIVLDYLECLLSKNPYKNKDDYTRQKAVAAEFRALVARMNVFGATASQSNRGSVQSGSNSDPAPINLDKLAESYGKAMPMDYVCSINQSMREYDGDGQEENKSHLGRFRLYIAKNRNGRKNVTVNASVNYATMKVKEDNL